MGTRNLTLVQTGGKYRIAQYGQWDGYPERAGHTVLLFLRNWDRDKFVKNLGRTRFLTEEEAAEISKKWREGEQPAEHIRRDMGAGVLQYIHDLPVDGAEILLGDNTDFAADGMFCEWAYVLDLDTNKLEVYRGGKTPPEPGERFAHLKSRDAAPGNPEYYPARKVAEWPIAELPETKVFCETCYNDSAYEYTGPVG